MKVKAVQKFWTEGRLVLEGEEIEVDESLGREVLNSGKAVLADAPKDEQDKSVS